MRKTIVAVATILAAILAVVALWASPPESEARKRIIETAQSFKGVPYVYGASSPEAFDCSGFVQYVYAQAADIQIPRNSKAQWAAGTPIEKTAVKPGDIFVFDTVGGGGPSHVAIFLGDDKMIHAISEGPKTGVVISPLADRYFAPRVIGARYFIAPSASAPAPAAPKPAAPAPAAQEAPKPAPAAQTAAAPAPAETKPAPAAPKPAAPAPAAQEAPKPAPAAQTAAAPAPAETKPAPAAPKPVTPAAPLIPATLVSEAPVSQIGFVVRKPGDVFMDPIPAATGTAIAFTITNGTGKDGVFHIFFYKADKDFSKTKILREERAMIRAGASQEIEAYTFTEPGRYRINVKTADNTQMMQRTWDVVDLGAKKRK